MKISREIQEGIDIDWFAVDVNGIVVHAASGGGMLPSSVAYSREDTYHIASFFRGMPYLEAEIEINSFIDEKVWFPSLESRKNYLEDFLSMSKRGLYSFDKTNPGNFSDVSYHLVCYPNNVIRVQNLPEEIRKILIRTTLSFDVRETISFFINEYGNVSAHSI